MVGVVSRKWGLEMSKVAERLIARLARSSVDVLTSSFFIPFTFTVM